MKTFFVTGTDEHGDKIAEAAQKAGITPQGICGQNQRAVSQTLCPELSITNDYFIRTTDANHIETVRYILQKVMIPVIFISEVTKDIIVSAANDFIWKKKWSTENVLIIRQSRSIAKKEIIFSE